MNRGLNIPKVKDILTKNVIAVRPDFSTLDVIEIFNKYRISSVPVVDEDEHVIGYLSESDSIRCMGNCLFFDEQRNTAVESIMSKQVLQANEEWDLFELDNFLIAHHINSAPVVDSQNYLIGVVTRRDALKALETIAKERLNYKREIKEPVEISMRQKIKMIINNRS